MLYEYYNMHVFIGVHVFGLLTADVVIDSHTFVKVFSQSCTFSGSRA